MYSEQLDLFEGYISETEMELMAYIWANLDGDDGNHFLEDSIKMNDWESGLSPEQRLTFFKKILEMDNKNMLKLSNYDREYAQEEVEHPEDCRAMDDDDPDCDMACPTPPVPTPDLVDDGLDYDSTRMPLLPPPNLVDDCNWVVVAADNTVIVGPPLPEPNWLADEAAWVEVEGALWNEEEEEAEFETDWSLPDDY